MKNKRKCRVIITAQFRKGGKESEEFKEYSRRSTKNGEANGGVVIEKYIIEKNLGNGKTPHIVLIVDYPSKKKALETFTNNEYKNIKNLRDTAFEEVNIYIPKE